MKFKFYILRILQEYKYPQYQITRKIKRIFIKKENLKVNDNLLAICDLNYVPFTYNFGQFLLVLSKRILTNKFNEIKLIFLWPSQDRIDFIKKNYKTEIIPPVNVDQEEMRWRFDNLLFPMIDLFPIKFDKIEIIYNRKKEINFDDYSNIYPEGYSNHNPIGTDLVEMFSYDRNEIIKYGQRTNEKSKKLVSGFFKSNNLDPKKCITITIRNYNFDKSRDSDNSVWLDFARYLKKNGIIVIIIPDAENLWGLKIFKNEFIYMPECSINLKLRFSLYEKTLFNFFTSGGPGGQSSYSSTKINFALYRCQEKKDSVVNTKANYKVIGENKQPKFLDQNQYYIYEDENLEGLIDFYKKNIESLHQKEF